MWLWHLLMDFLHFEPAFPNNQVPILNHFMYIGLFFGRIVQLNPFGCRPNLLYTFSRDIIYEPNVNRFMNLMVNQRFLLTSNILKGFTFESCYMIEIV